MKGIKTILGALAAASLLFSVSANAQENANRDENGKVVRGAYETNRAFDNTFISLGGGINAVWEASEGFGRITPATEVDFGKWWTPAVGMRIGWHGLNMSAKSEHITGAAYNYFHGDLLWNISNSIGGYKETRFWNFAPYVSAGIALFGKNNTPGVGAAFKGASAEFQMGLGLLNVLRLSDRVALHLDLGTAIVRAAGVGENGINAALKGAAFNPYATLGIAFNLGKTGFNRHSSITPVVIPVPFTVDQYNALKDRVDALEKENAELKDQVAQLQQIADKVNNLVDGQTYLYKDGNFTAVDVVTASPLTLYFDCGKTTLSKRELAHLDYFNSSVVNEDVKLEVNGYADKQTGSAKRNQYLSEERVKYVKNLLVKAGAKEENLTGEGKGASVQLFDGAANNRVVTIEVK